jgi:hypothetical protein
VHVLQRRAPTLQTVEYGGIDAQVTEESAHVRSRPREGPLALHQSNALQRAATIIGRADGLMNQASDVNLDHD